MKVKFSCDSGANNQSMNDSGWIDIVDDYGFIEGEWESMTYDEKHEIAKGWAWESGLEISFDEKP